MGKINRDKERISPKKNNVLIVLLLILSVLLTVYFMPKSRSEYYDYTIGKPWTYDVLIAPFNFSIE